MTVLEAIQKSAEFLAKKGVESPRLQTELLLAHLLKLPRMKLYLNFERALTPAETDALREFVKRRGQREPLQHITGSTSFCGFEIAVNRHALVPRPETELLAESGWEFLSKLGRPHPRGHASRPRRRSNLLWTSAPAPAASPSRWRQNVRPQKSSRRTFRRTRSRWPRKMPRETTSPNGLNFCKAMVLPRFNRRDELHESQIRRLKQNQGLAELAPPKMELISSSAIRLTFRPPKSPRSSRKCAILIRARALDGGADGLDFYRKLAAEAKPFLKPGGKIMLEFGDGQAEAIRKIFEDRKVDCRSGEGGLQSPRKNFNRQIVTRRRRS